MSEWIWVVRFREKGTEEWHGPFTFTEEIAAQSCYAAWASDGIHEAKIEKLAKGRTA